MALCAGNQWSWNFKCTKPSETMGSTESWWAGVVQPPFGYAVNADAVGWFWRNKTAEMHGTVEWPKGQYPENLTGVWGSQHFSVTNVNLFGYWWKYRQHPLFKSQMFHQRSREMIDVCLFDRFLLFKKSFLRLLDLADGAVWPGLPVGNS